MRRPILLATALAMALSSCSEAEPEGDATPESTPTVTAVEAATTAPGTDLELGDSAVLVWQPESSLTGVLDLAVDAVAEQRQSVFDGWVRDDVMAAARPYFVTVSLTNAGESDLAGQVVPLYLRDDAGALGGPWTLGGDFTACQSGPLPSPFEPGAAAEMCLVYLVPDGGRIQDMVFEPTEGYDPITWTGEVEEPARRTAKDDKDDKDDKEGKKKRG